MGFGSPLSESLRANPMEPDHETGLTPRAVAGATRSDGSASADSPSASVSCSLVFADAVGGPTLYAPRIVVSSGKRLVYVIVAG